MDNDQHWKEQLGFISGTIVVWGTFLLSTWPRVAMFQTGLNAHAWTFFGLRERINPGWDAYETLITPLALGVSVLLFSALHLLSRGFWLGIVGTQQRRVFSELASEFLNRLANSSYSAVFGLWILAANNVLFTLLLFLSATIELLIARHFAGGSIWPRIIPTLIILIPIVILYRLARRAAVKLRLFADLSIRQLWVKLILLVILFIGVFGVCTEMCYTAALSADKKLVARSKSEYVEILVTLGGATSDANIASLQLIDTERGGTKHLNMVPLGEGQYASYILSSDLAEGHYRVEFSYPHLALDALYPYLNSHVKHSWPLIVVP